MLIVVACVTLHNFIQQETRIDWLFEQYGKENPIIIDNDDEGDDDDQVESLMPS